MNSRLKDICKKLSRHNLDALLICHPHNVSYLTDTRSRDSYLLVSPKESFYFTDFRYFQEAKDQLRGITAKRIEGSVFALIARTCNGLKLRRVGFEERHLPFAEYAKIKEDLLESVELVPIVRLVEDLRQIKSSEELEKIERAVKITVAAFKFIRGLLRPGKKEIEVAAELERFIRYNGAYASAFDIIVASGPNSSYPHHITSQRRLKADETVLIDLGVDYAGYKSDLTRVFFLGKINALFRGIYDIVRQAQSKAINAIKPAVHIKKVDAAARQLIAQKGYGGFFGHSLGHGVGLEVHEAPSISPQAEGNLQSGMVITIEPAIYLPHKFGVRIEDMVLVTKKGCAVLSGSLNK